MKNKNTLKNALVALVVILVILVILGAVVIGYFAFRQNDNAPEGPSTNPGTTQQSNSTNKPGETEKPDEIVKDSTLTKELEQEKIVELGQVYVRGDVAYGAIVVKATASKQQAQKIAEEYMKRMKKQYKNSKINVQVVRDGENLVNLTHGF